MYQLMVEYWYWRQLPLDFTLWVMTLRTQHFIQMTNILAYNAT